MSRRSNHHAKTSRVLIVLFILCGAPVLGTADAAAQDLFELEVFEYGGVPPGDHEVELHANVMSRGSVAADSAAASHRPAHISVEVARGWTDRIETSVFIQTAPFGPSGTTRFAGGHIRSKLRLGEVRAVPLRVAVSAEYTFNHPAFDHQLQTLELRSILDYEQGNLSVVVNPSVELVTRGSDDGLEPVFDLSARAAWQLKERVALTTDYFSAAATTRHLQPEVSAHHLLFGGLDVDIGAGWGLGVSAGHCVTSSEPWLMKSVVGYRF